MYIKTDTQTPLSLGQIKQEHPRTAFPKGGPDDDWLSDNGYARLKQSPKPDVTDTQVAELDGVEQVEGEWQTKWTVRDKTTEELNREVIAARLKAYGTPAEQIEYITENGIVAWQDKVQQIKNANPKYE